MQKQRETTKMTGIIWKRNKTNFYIKNIIVKIKTQCINSGPEIAEGRINDLKDRSK